MWYDVENLYKQLETWWEINEDVPEFVKFHDFVESLKVNKEVKDLPCYVGEHFFLSWKRNKTRLSRKSWNFLISSMVELGQKKLKNVSRTS